MPAPLPNPIKTNPLGQFGDEALDATKSVAQDTVRGVGSLLDPKKILESILGKSNSSSPGETASIENMTGGQQGTTDPNLLATQQQNLIAQRHAADRAKAEALLSLHRQRLQEEQAHFSQSTQQTEMEEQKEEHEEKKEEQEKVMQLQHEKEKQNVLGSMIKQFEGSKEQKAWGAG